MAYVDGFIFPLPTKSLAAYRKIAKIAGTVWKQHGALEYRECIGDDLNVSMGIPFTNLVKPKKGETIAFSWIVYKSKAERNRVNAKVMKDPRILDMMKKKMPFDCKRMSYGGFKTIVDMM